MRARASLERAQADAVRRRTPLPLQEMLAFKKQLQRLGKKSKVGWRRAEHAWPGCCALPDAAAQSGPLRSCQRAGAAAQVPTPLAATAAAGQPAAQGGSAPRPPPRPA